MQLEDNVALAINASVYGEVSKKDGLWFLM